VKAIRWHGRGDVRLDEIPEPAVAAPDEMLLEVLLCGVCGTDLEEYRHGPVVVPVGTPHPLTGRSAPLTLGHEFCGVVLHVGEEVEGFRVGDRVAVEGNLHCGECRWCRAGEVQLCPHVAQYGLMGDGGLAEYAVVRDSTCLLLPPEADLRLGALAEPLAVAVRAVRRSRLEADDTVAIIGGGPIGLFVAEVARAYGARRVVVVEPDARRRDLALRIGVDEAIDPAAVGDGSAIVPDIAFECSGQPGTADQAIRMVRRGGRAVLVAAIPAATLDTGFLVEEKEIVASVSHQLRADFEVGLRLALAGEVAVTDVVTEVTDLPGAIARFFAGTASYASVGKVLVAPNGRFSGL